MIELAASGWEPIGLGAIPDLAQERYGPVDLARSQVRLDPVEEPSPSCPACAGKRFGFPAELDEHRTGGTAANVVANQVTLRGTLRWLDTALRARALASIDRISGGICSALRVSHQLEVTATVPVLQCAPDPIARLTAAAAVARVTAVDPGILPVSDDFAHIADRVPAAFIAIGAGGPTCGAHHAPDFDIDERAIGLTAEILTRTALAR